MSLESGIFRIKELSSGWRRYCAYFGNTPDVLMIELISREAIELWEKLPNGEFSFKARKLIRDASPYAQERAKDYFPV